MHGSDWQSCLTQDPEVIRQKGSRLAQLAVRRHQRQIKAPDRADRLARSNAVVMRRAAQSLIRGHVHEVESGWADAPREAAVLCFDEVQITDPFTAIALKGDSPVTATSAWSVAWPDSQLLVSQICSGHFCTAFAAVSCTCCVTKLFTLCLISIAQKVCITTGMMYSFCNGAAIHHIILPCVQFRPGGGLDGGWVRGVCHKQQSALGTERQWAPRGPVCPLFGQLAAILQAAASHLPA